MALVREEGITRRISVLGKLGEPIIAFQVRVVGGSIKALRSRSRRSRRYGRRMAGSGYEDFTLIAATDEVGKSSSSRLGGGGEGGRRSETGGRRRAGHGLTLKGNGLMRGVVRVRAGMVIGW